MEAMKILIGYDGSPYAEAALADLNRAGLPRKVEAMALSVSEELIPVPASLGGVATSYPRFESEAEDEALKLARSAKAALKTLFPDWQVHAEAATGSPGNMLIWKSEEWKPDLIVVGSQGSTALGRFFFGSVSQKVLHQANCSVRIARPGRKSLDAPVRLIVGVDGSPDSDAAVRAITTRHWPKGSEVCVVSGMMVPPPMASGQMAIEIEKWIAGQKARIAEPVEAAVSKLQGIGLATSSVVREEDPRGLLCAEAESRDADCIFVGTRGMGWIERTLIGSVSSVVAVRAHCSVEVVR
ncbi:MAG TPA: universal stress protein [Blastocatellia bacterium]|nr:universal stress protein [Blastocatellia bacterium]